MKYVLVHDWLTSLAGAEKVLEALCEIYANAPIFTLVKDEMNIAHSKFYPKEIHTSFLQKFPKASKWYRYYMPFFPLAIESFDLSNFDVVVSTSHAVAKGVLTTHKQLHICYCHTPMRYIWDLVHQYLREVHLDKGLKGFIVKMFMHYLRIWDICSVNRVDYFVANSKYIAKRIKHLYNRQATVIYPPVNVELFSVLDGRDNFYLTASRFVPYKKIDIVVEAFSHMPEKRLVVIGDGPDNAKIKAKATRNVELVGALPFEQLRFYLQKAKAFIFAAEEDFGILPVEAQACGTPVIAYRAGGVLETVEDNITGLFFDEQSSGCIVDIIRNFDRKQDCFDANVIRQHALQFSKERFKKEFSVFVSKCLDSSL